MDIMNILITHPLFLVGGVGILGLMIGSFLNVVIYRLPIILKNEYERDCLEYLHNEQSKNIQTISLSIPRSYCPQCNATISWWQNIPVISYIMLRGRCNTCQAVISWRYPIVEMLSCAASIWVAIYFGNDIKTLMVLTITWVLIAAIFIDLDHLLLPDNITLPLLWCGLLANTVDIFTSPTNAIIGAALGYTFPWSINKIFKWLRKVDGMGHGDFKLFAAFGGWLGWQMLPLILLAASFTGAIVGVYFLISKKAALTKPLPFGPHLVVAGWLAFFWGQPIINWYLYH